MVRTMVTFTVAGRQEPAGSKTRNRYAGVRDANLKLKPWQAEVARVARKAMAGADLMAGPLSVQMKFYRALGKNDLLADGRTLTVARRRNPYPTTRPDVLKLARAVEDALTGVVWEDDAQIVDEFLYKRFVYRSEGASQWYIPRVYVIVRAGVH
jgi:Holliday junction resolvase RusA-like endonuclease